MNYALLVCLVFYEIRFSIVLRGLLPIACLCNYLWSLFFLYFFLPFFSFKMNRSYLRTYTGPYSQLVSLLQQICQYLYKESSVYTDLAQAGTWVKFLGAPLRLKMTWRLPGCSCVDVRNAGCRQTYVQVEVFTTMVQTNATCDGRSR